MTSCHSQIEAVGDLTQSLPLPLKGEGLGIVCLGFVGFASLVHNWVALAQQGAFEASLVSLPYLAFKIAHRATQGASLVFLFLCALGVPASIFLQAHLKPGCENSYSLFTPPQMLRWPLPRFWISKRLEFLPAFAIIFIPQPGSGQTASRY